MKPFKLRPLPCPCGALLVAALALLLSACGPGVGGTGTGTDTPQASLDYFGAVAAPVCGSDLAPQLPCAAAVPGGAVQVATAAHFVDQPAAPQLHLELQGDGARLRGPCDGITFSGLWGVRGTQAGRFYGEVERAGRSSPATLVLTAGDGGWRTQLFDADGVSLLGPVALQPVAAAPAIACR